MVQQLKRIVRPFYRAARTSFERYQLRRAVGTVPLRVMVGAGPIRQAGWIATDIHQLNLCLAADWRRYFQEGTIDALLAEHVWEHLTPADAASAAAFCLRYLRPGGYLRVAVPDGLSPDPHYIEQVRPGGSGPGADDHKVLYTYRSLGQLFTAAGFQVELLEYYDEAGKLNTHPWNPEDGLIRRSLRHDERNRDGKIGYTSLILDAIKPALTIKMP